MRKKVYLRVNNIFPCTYTFNWTVVQCSCKPYHTSTKVLLICSSIVPGKRVTLPVESTLPSQYAKKKNPENFDWKSSHRQLQIQSCEAQSMQWWSKNANLPLKLLPISREYVKVVSRFGCQKKSLSFTLHWYNAF